MNIRCLKCGSTNMRVQTETDNKFSVKKGFLGTALFGAVGAVMGINGKKETKKNYICQACGCVSDRCMMEATAKSIDDALCTNNTVMLSVYKTTYYNIEWEESIAAPSSSVNVTEPAATNNSPTIPQLLKRAASFLEDGEWKKADQYCEKILDADCENAEAYLIKAMAELKITNRSDLSSHPEVLVSKWADKAYHYAQKNNLALCHEMNELKEIATTIEIKCIEIPNGITAIKKEQFMGWNGLKKVILPPSVQTIEESAFQFCKNLTHITIPNGVTNIAKNAFSYCESLMQVTLPTSVTSIGEGAFEGCDILYVIYNNSDLDIAIGGDDYGEIAWNAQLIIDKNNTYIWKEMDNYSFNMPEDNLLCRTFKCEEYECAPCLIAYLGEDETLILPPHINGNEYSITLATNAECVVWPESESIFHTTMGVASFFNCPRLKRVIIPKSVTEIKPGALGGPNLTEISYQGTKADWMAIQKKDNWDDLLNDYTIYCIDGIL